jgi:Family of unknown function (DUF6703)
MPAKQKARVQTVATRGTSALFARLNRLNPTVVFLTVLVLVLGGLLLPRPYGGILLLALAGALAALLTTTWQRGSRQTRTARVVILTLLIVLMVYRLV